MQASHYSEKLIENLKASIEMKQKLLTSDQIENFGKAVDRLVQAYKQGGRLYIAGNGGSAADAQHIAAELVVKLCRPRPSIAAEALTVDTSTLLAIGNDFSFDEVFSRQLEAKASAKDVFLAITTSGQSKNILKALEECKKLGTYSILLTGKDGGKAFSMADCSILVPEQDTNRIQEAHMVLYHTLCACVEQALFA